MAARLVQIILAAVVGALIVWDIRLATDSVQHNTISRVVLALSRRRGMVGLICLAAGYLLGHLTWPQLVEVVKDCR